MGCPSHKIQTIVMVAKQPTIVMVAKQPTIVMVAKQPFVTRRRTCQMQK